MTRSTRFPTLTRRAPSSAMPDAMPLARPAGVSHSTAAPVADGARRRQRASSADASPRASVSSSAASAASTSASTTHGSTARPNSVSTDVARSARSAGYAAGLMLMPRPRMTCCSPSLDDDPSASTPASFAPARRAARIHVRAGRDHVVGPLDLERQPGGGADAFGHRHATSEGQQRRAARVANDQGHVEAGAGRRAPASPEPAATRRLSRRDDRRTLGRPPLGVRGGEVVGRGRLVKIVERMAEPAATRSRSAQRIGELRRDRVRHVSVGRRSDLEAEIDRRSGVRQGTDRHVVGSRAGELGHALERHAT